MHSYMEGAFTFLDNCDIDDYLEHGIIRNGFEVRFLLEVLKQTRQYFQKVTLLYESDDENDNYSEAFKTIFYDAMILVDPLYSNDYFVQLKEQEEAEYCFPASGIRTSFNFEELKTELATTNSNEEKIKLIHETLIDYEQYFITLDAEYRLDILGSRRVVGSDFYRLCKAELRRYEDEKAENMAAAVIEKVPGADTPYRWVASNTDLLELLVALMEEGAIQRMDGEKLSRKELIDSACRRLNIEIKDAEGKLNKATARKSSLTPFLDKLKHSFVNYVNQKDEKQQKRR